MPSIANAIKYAKMASNTHNKLKAVSIAATAPAPAPAPALAPALAPARAASAPTTGGSHIFLIAGVLCVLLMLLGVAVYVYKNNNKDTVE